MIAGFLVLPIALGWHHTALSRQQVLGWTRDGTVTGRIEAKFMYAEDLPSGLFNSIRRPMPGKGYWVLASSSPGLAPYGCGFFPCSPPTAWSMAYVADDAPLIPPVAGVASGVMDPPRWPAVFDRLPDRGAPTWWPLVPPRMVAVPAALLSLVLGIVVLVRARRQGRPT